MRDNICIGHHNNHWWGQFQIQIQVYNAVNYGVIAVSYGYDGFQHNIVYTIALTKVELWPNIGLTKDTIPGLWGWPVV